jgi:1-acyl-sn-glycerol-3-phosphate acyltransferase
MRSVSPPPSLPLRAWLTIWGALRWYHRYTVEGLENILDSPPALIVGYHGRPMAFDMCMLTVELYERLGYLPHGVTNGSVDAIPALKWFSDGLGFFSGDSDEIDRVIARGEHLILTPGAALEGSRSFRQRYKVNWGQHVGYLRLALRHGLRIIPVAAAGSDDAYIGLNDGYALGRRIGLPRGWALWFGLGPLGLFPFSPPFPVRFHQLVGEPIDLGAGERIDPNDRAALLRLHEKVTSTVQKLLDRALTRQRAMSREQ